MHLEQISVRAANGHNLRNRDASLDLIVNYARETIASEDSGNCRPRFFLRFDARFSPELSRCCDHVTNLPD